MTRRFDAVLFDAGGVLLLPDPHVFGPLLAYYGGDPSVDAHRRAHYAGMAAKASVDAAAPSPVDGLLEEWQFFQRALATDAARERMDRFMALGGQTREVELDLAAMLEKLETKI